MTRIQFDNDSSLAACADCDWKGPAEALHAIVDFEQRVTPGEVCPAGECPACGALAHLVESAP